MTWLALAGLALAGAFRALHALLLVVCISSAGVVLIGMVVGARADEWLLALTIFGCGYFMGRTA